MDRNIFASLISNIRFALLICIMTLVSCQKDDSVVPDEPILLTTISGHEISMNGIWSSGCVAANNNMILNESLTFNDQDLQIDIKGYDNPECNGAEIFEETVIITFSNAGITTVLLDGMEVQANKIDGTATYMDGKIENFKQVFLIHDASDDLYMHHALFENDGGEVNSDGYPVEIIPIAIIKTN